MGERVDQLSRRELLRRIATVLGVASVSPMLVSAAMADVKATASARRFLPADQLRLVEVLVEMILPATDTPGASAVGVHHFIDALLADCFSRAHQEAFVAGLAGVDAAARERGFDNFLSAGKEAQYDMARVMDQNSVESESASRRSFFAELKQLTLLGYYTSETGATQELAYQPIPGAYKGCVPYEELGRAWAT